MKSKAVFFLYATLVMLSDLGFAQVSAIEKQSDAQASSTSFESKQAAFREFGIDLIASPDGKLAAICNFDIAVGLAGEFPTKDFEELKLARLYISSGSPSTPFIEGLRKSRRSLQHLSITSHEMPDAQISELLKCLSSSRLTLSRPKIPKIVLDELSKEKFPVVWIATEMEMRESITVRQKSLHLPKASSFVLFFRNKGERKGDAAH